MTTTNSLERAMSPALRVDRAVGVTRGVRIIGPSGKNRRRYLPEALGPRLYEGKAVHFDHLPEAAPNSQRRVSSRVGWLENVRRERRGLTGDLHVVTNHPYGPALLEAAEERGGYCWEIHLAMSAITVSATWPGCSYSAGVLWPSPSMKRWLHFG